MKTKLIIFYLFIYITIIVIMHRLHLYGLGFSYAFPRYQWVYVWMYVVRRSYYVFFYLICTLWLFHASQIFHGVEHKYHSHCIGVVTGSVLSRWCWIAQISAAVTVDWAGIFAKLLALFGVRLDDVIVVDPALGFIVSLKKKNNRVL